VSDAPFIQLYVGDYLSDTLDLTTEQHGAYLLLLLTMWKHGGSLPNDPKKLARIARVSPRRWHMIWSEIARFFCDDGSEITNERLKLEREKVLSISRKRSAAGVKGAEAKALKENDPASANATANEQAGPKHSQKSEPEPYRSEDTNVSLSLLSDEPCAASDIAYAVQRYNDAARKAGWPEVQKNTPQRAKMLKARIKDAGGIEGWEDALRKAFESDFCRGMTAKPWTGFGFDWLVKAGNFTKLMEGNYDNRTDDQGRAGRGSGSGMVDAFASVAARRSAKQGRD
tara:strand:+ start:6373 stop:7227 length:855 start_codon:yes stop_codon:yes gene_type:complete